MSYNTFYWVLFQYNTCLWLRLNRNLCRMKCVLKDKPLLWDHFKSLYLFNNLSYTNFFLWNPLPSKSICCWHMCWWSLYLQSSYFVDICVDGLSAFKVHILLTYVLIVSAFKVHILLTYVLMVPLPSKSICCWHMCWWSLPSKFIFCWHMCWWSLCLQSPYFVDICVDGLSAFKDHILLTNGSYVSLPSKTLHVGRFLLQ